MIVKQAVDWNTGPPSRARSARVPASLLTGPGLDLTDWVSDDSPGEIQDAVEEAVHQLIETGQLSAAMAEQRKQAWLCRRCKHLK